jgi:hypothetical protein
MGGKKKRGAGRGGTHFKGADGGEGKEGGLVRCATWRAMEGGAGPTTAAGDRHRPWNGGCARCGHAVRLA